MPELALHPITKKQLDDFVARPSHALLLTGAAGSGKTAIAEWLAAHLLKTTPEQLAGHAYVRQIVPIDNKAISIEVIRSIEQFLSLKVPGPDAIKRVIIINQAQLLGIEAQNALLKTLEEPPEDTVLIMTAISAEQLLPTIQSRLQSIAVTRPSKAALQSGFATHTTSLTAFNQAYNISGGLPGLLHALLTDVDHPLTPAVELARTVLGETTYERLNEVDRLTKDKVLAQNMLAILQQMAHLSLQTAAGPASKRWQRVLTASYNASVALTQNAQPKLALTTLMLELA